MARYKVKRKRGLGYVHYVVPDGSSQAKTESLTTGAAQRMSDIYGKYLTPELQLSDPVKYAEYLKKRDDGIVQILDLWKVPYNRDDSFGSATVGQKIIVADVPISQTVILDENNNEVPIETVLNDTNSQVTLTDEFVETDEAAQPQAKDNTLLYVGAGILVVSAMILMGGKKKKQPAMGAAASRKKRKSRKTKK